MRRKITSIFLTILLTAFPFLISCKNNNTSPPKEVIPLHVGEEKEEEIEEEEEEKFIPEYLVFSSDRHEIYPETIQCAEFVGRTTSMINTRAEFEELLNIYIPLTKGDLDVADFEKYQSKKNQYLFTYSSLCIIFYYSPTTTARRQVKNLYVKDNVLHIEIVDYIKRGTEVFSTSSYAAYEVLTINKEDIKNIQGITSELIGKEEVNNFQLW